MWEKQLSLHIVLELSKISLSGDTESQYMIIKFSRCLTHCFVYTCFYLYQSVFIYGAVFYLIL